MRVAGRVDLPPSPDLSSGLGVGAVPGGGWGVGRLPGWQIRRLRPQLAGLLRDANHSQTPAEMGGGGGGGAAGGGVPFSSGVVSFGGGWGLGDAGHYLSRPLHPSGPMLNSGSHGPRS